jgi:PPOX class probable F420-dependent enzyme
VARDAKEGVMASLADFEAMVPRESGLAVLTVIGPDGRMRPSVVNVSVLDHPVTGERTVAAVIHGRARKLAHLRARPRASVVLRASWQWAGVEGPVQIAGPDDPMAGIDAERLRLLLREIFTAAGGTHEDFDEFDKVMAQDRRAAVLVAPERVFTNG